MIKLDFLRGNKLALFGLGASGIATAKAIEAGGGEVICWDDNEISRIKSAQQNIKLNHLAEIDWQDISYLILAPGVPLNYPKPHWCVELAQKNDIEIVGDIELFLKQKGNRTDCPFFAITGTNGKSTTTNLISHILRCLGKNVQMGGNIGIPVLELEDFAPNNCYVIECSSFQLDLTPSFQADIGILLNITPDHIDRHGSFENYKKSKMKVVEHSKIAFWQQNLHGYYIIEKKIYYKDKLLVNLSNSVSLRGEHNIYNCLNAIAAVQQYYQLWDVDWQEICMTYESLSHRMQQVRQIGDIIFINDSKATNAEATIPAINSFNNIYWIIGGIAKKGGIENLRTLFHKIHKAYLIGEAAKDFANTIDKAFLYENCGTLEKAVDLAYRDAKQSGKPAVILLSPACASYDQFANYSSRGDAFIKIVSDIKV